MLSSYRGPISYQSLILRGYCTFYPQTSMSLCSISKLSTFFENITYASYSKKCLVNCPRNPNITQKFRQAKRCLSCWSKQHFHCLIQSSKNPICLSKFQCHFSVPWTTSCMSYFSRKCWLFWGRTQNMSILGRRCSTPLKSQASVLIKWQSMLF